MIVKNQYNHVDQMDMEIVKVYYIFMQHSPITMRTWNFYIADNSIWVRLNNIPTLKLMIHWSRLTGWIVWYQTLFRIKSWFNWLACLFFLFFFSWSHGGSTADETRILKEHVGADTAIDKQTTNFQLAVYCCKRNQVKSATGNEQQNNIKRCFK